MKIFTCVVSNAPLSVFFLLIPSTKQDIQLHGAAEARRAHNPEVTRSKRVAARFLFFSVFFSFPFCFRSYRSHLFSTYICEFLIIHIFFFFTKHLSTNQSLYVFFFPTIMSYISSFDACRSHDSSAPPTTSHPHFTTSPNGHHHTISGLHASDLLH